MLQSIKDEVGKPPGVPFLSREESGKHKIFADGSAVQGSRSLRIQTYFRLSL